MMTETREVRLKRLKMRSMRRGIKEMDILLIAYSDAKLDQMNDAELDVYEQLLHENDQDLLQWVTGQVEAPEALRELVFDISQIHQKI